MKKTILITHLKKRRETAVKVQKLLTDYGCMIKTRLGIHDGVLDKCSNTGLIILELVGSVKDKKAFASKLKAIPEVEVKLVNIG